MSDPYIGEIRAFCFSFAPVNWAFCDGQEVDVNQNPSLFALLGTYYGGDGYNTFGLPNLKGRVAIHAGYGAGLSPRMLGGTYGYPTVPLTADQIPAHSHSINADNVANQESTAPEGRYISGSENTANKMYLSASGAEAQPPTMSSSMVNSTGGHPHENRQPFLVFNYCIALDGQFPPRS